MQQELEFTKVSEDSNIMVAEAVVNGDFNLHVEMVKSGKVIVSVSTVEGGKKAIKGVGDVGNDGVYDEDYDAIVYPKYVEVRTTSKVRVGYITEVS